MFTTDCTREALCDLLRENPRGLLVHRDELAGWARSLNQYKGGKGNDKQFWLNLWSGEPVAVNRRGRRVHVKPASVGTAVRRHRLVAVGQGKTRRFSRATIETLQDRLCRGASVETSNQYLTHLKSFCRWLVKDRRMGDSPLAHLEAGNTKVDRRHDRRELTEEELRRLLAITRDSKRAFRGMNGADRFYLYATACGSGFRASALASLTPDSFDLESTPPTVTLAARFNKNRKPRVQPLPLELAKLLQDYLKDKRAGEPVWGGTWARDGKGSEMLRSDLEAAGIPYETVGPDGPLFADFHALRHSYITALGRGGVDLRTAQELAGHSTPILTARYSHRRLQDLAGAVMKLPNFLPREPESQRVQATGTEGPVCLEFAQNTDLSEQRLSPSGQVRGVGDVAAITIQPLVSQGFSPQQSSSGISRLEGG